jgi:hypothetical protein
MTCAGVKFLKTGGKIMTQVGGKFFELIKEGGKVLRVPQPPNKELPNAVFMKNTGKPGASGGKPAPKVEPPKPERIVNTPEDCDKYAASKVSDRICKECKPIDGRGTYEVIKKDNILKKGDLLTRDTKHHEWELFNERGKHKGAIDPKTGKLYKPADPRKQINRK